MRNFGLENFSIKQMSQEPVFTPPSDSEIHVFSLLQHVPFDRMLCFSSLHMMKLITVMMRHLDLHLCLCIFEVINSDLNTTP